MRRVGKLDGGGIISCLLLLLRPVTLILISLCLSSFSLFYYINGRDSTEDHNNTFVRGSNNNASKNNNNVDPGGNSLVKIDASLSTMNPLDVWETLIKTPKKEKTTVIEVGVHSPKQCIDAAKRGYDTHCFEPSPLSYSRIERGIGKITTPETRDRIHIYNQAVGATSGQTIPFHSTGGTGDHVGEYDMWRMKKHFVSQSEQDLKKRGTIVQVNNSLFLLLLLLLLMIEPPLELGKVDEGDDDVRISFSWRCCCRRCCC
jgi:hypothetical protein